MYLLERTNGGNSCSTCSNVFKFTNFNFSQCRVMAIAFNRPKRILLSQHHRDPHARHLAQLLLPLISHVSLTLLNPLKSLLDCVLLYKVMATAMAALISSFPAMFPLLFHSETPFPFPFPIPLPFGFRLQSRIIGISIRKWPTNAKIIAATK